MNLSLAPTDLAAIASAVADELERRGTIAGRLDPDRLAYTERQAAATIGVPWYTLRDLRLSGEIAAVKVGRSYCYSRETLLKFLEGCR